MSGNISQRDIAAAHKELLEVRDEWLQRSYVTAIDIGLHMEAGRQRKELAIRVHVRPDTPNGDALAAAFPEKLGPYPVDIITAEYGLQEAATADE